MLAPGAAGLVGSWSQENADPLNQGRLARGAPGSLGGDERVSLDGRVITQVVEGPAGWALAATKAGTVYALDASGEVVWKASVGDELRTAPVWTGEVVVAVPRGDTAHAFTATGEKAWTLAIENERPEAALVRMASPIATPRGDAIVATMAGKLHRVAPNGTVEWTYDVGGEDAIEATPAITNDGDVIAAGFIPGQEGRGKLVRIDGKTGTTDCSACWTRDIGSQVVGAPTVVADQVLVPLRDGNALQARSLSDGSLRWETAFDDSVPASPSLHEGLAIVGDIRGTVRAVDVSGGKIEWEFNPLSDDPNADELASSQCSALTVADSIAVDASGVAWTPYWKADICSGFPPQDSRSSPFYRLDAQTGEVLDRQRYDKANHGPSLLASGVWTGSDLGGVRTYPSSGSSISTFTQTAPGEVLLLTNTNLEGSWTLAWDGEVSRSGDGKPPHIVRKQLSPGEHEFTLTVGEGSSTGHVTVPASDDGDRSADASQPPSENGTSPPPTEDSPSADDPTSANGSNTSGDTDETPLAPILALLALIAAAWGRRRA